MAALAAAENFRPALELVLKSEGGYVSHPNDRGGCTNMGITLDTLKQFTGDASLSCDAIKNLSQDQAAEIYRRSYWDGAGLGLIEPYEPALCIFDQGVLRGTKRAGMQAQMVANELLGSKLTLDGKIGPVTAKAISAIDPDIFSREYLQASRHALNDIVVRDQSQVVFLQGWHSRIDRLEDVCWGKSGGVAPTPAPRPVEVDVPVVAPGLLAPYRWAEQEMKTGVREIAGSKANNARILYYHAHTSYHGKTDEVPWCASFVCTALEVNGFYSTRSAAAHAQKDAGTRLSSPELGCIMVIQHPSGGWHVCFYAGPSGSKAFKGLGGNQSNSVNVTIWNNSEIRYMVRPRKLAA